MGSVKQKLTSAAQSFPLSMVTEKRLDLGNISEIKLMGFANEFDAGYEKEFRMTQSLFDLLNNKIQLSKFEDLIGFIK